MDLKIIFPLKFIVSERRASSCQRFRSLAKSSLCGLCGPSPTDCILSSHSHPKTQETRRLRLCVERRVSPLPPLKHSDPQKRRRAHYFPPTQAAYQASHYCFLLPTLTHARTRAHAHTHAHTVVASENSAWKTQPCQSRLLWL